MKKNLYFLLLILSLGCSSPKSLSFKDSLISVVKSDEFKNSFRLCDKKNDSIKIFNNTDKKFERYYPNLSCGKTLIIEKSNLVIDVNKPTKFEDEKIILYKFENLKNKQVFTFLNNHSNINLVISINTKKEIKIIERGVF